MPESNSVLSHFTSTYTTFSGVDITAMFDDMSVMTLQGIAVSVTREKVPVYVFGKSRPVSISRGKRGIAGTLQLVLFDREALWVMYDDHKYYAHQDEIDWLQDPTNVAERTGAVGGAAQSVLTRPDYMDQIWPFDITLLAQNEYGQGAWSSVLGVEIINEGGGISMDDLTNERQATYIAIHRTPWAPIANDRGDEDPSSVQSYTANHVVMNEESGEFSVNPTRP